MQQDRVDTIIKDDDVDTLQQVNDYVAMNQSKKCVIPMLQSINSYVLDSYVRETYFENGNAINIFDADSKKSEVYKEAYFMLKALTDQNLISKDMRKYESPIGYDTNEKLTPVFTKTGVHVETFSADTQSSQAA